MMSPQRRRSSGDTSTTTVSNSTAIVISPRRGFDSKRQRKNAPQAITDFAGWGVCSISEFSRFCIGDQFVLIIPADHKKDNKFGIKQRKALRTRVIATVATNLAGNTPASAKAPLRKTSNSAQTKIAEQHLIINHGIERRQLKYIELRCSIHQYPHRDDYLNDVLSISEITTQIRQHEGIYVTLLDYPSTNASNVIHIRWSEVPFIQVWSAYFRGDFRPAIMIGNERGTTEFVNELENTYNQFKDDNQRLSELLLSYERKKNEQLAKTIKSLERECSNAVVTTNHLSEDFINLQLKAEMTDTRVPEFSTYADNVYKEAWTSHYSDFNPNTPLLSTSAMIQMHDTIESTFPMHYACLKSMIYGKRSHEPQRARTHYNLEKRNVLVHYFFCLLRERDRHNMVHWALVATVALHYRGIDANAYRNGNGRSWSLDLKIAMDMLEDIYKRTHRQRMTVLKNQRILMSALDNYNRFQRFTTQRCGKSGVFHNGIVFSAVRAKEFNKPPGSILRNNKSESWKVMTSSLSSDCKTCTVTAMLLQEWKNASDEHTPTGIVCTITLPSKDWKIVSIPGSSAAQVTITHVKQVIPSSLRQKIPITVDTRNVICADRSWMATVDSNVQYRVLPVREFATNVRLATKLIELWKGIASPLFAGSATDSTNDDSATDITNEEFRLLQNSTKLFQKEFMTKIGGTDESITLQRNIKRYQLHSLEYFNEAYHTVDEYVWLPLLAKDEMHKDELYLATVDILSQFGMIDTSSGKAQVVPGSDFRRLFQFGDVLTIQKLHQLNPSVLRNMTHIGNEVSALALHKMFNNNSIRNHDYLHENIHRLQAIYKIYYPGFIEICCSIIGAKRVKIDPTKGSWRDHENMVLKIALAIKHLRLHNFLQQESPSLNVELTPMDRLWNLQDEYSNYCQSLLVCPDEVTRYCALFLDAVDRWENCKEAVRMGDWATLEVEALDWLPIWAATKKPLYALETMRRNEINYNLDAEELEYMRMGRFVRLTPNGACISYDDFCEKQNYAMKQCSNHPDMEVMVRKSHHLHAASRCFKLMVGNESGRHAAVPSTHDDVQALYKFFVRCRIFRTPNNAQRLDDMSFAQHVIIESFDNSSARKKINQMASPTLSQVEISLLSQFHSEDNVAEYDDDLDCNDERGDNVILDDDESVTSTSSAVERDVGELGRSNINMMGIINLFDVDADALQEAVSKRLATVAEEQAWKRLIEQSVEYFNGKLEKKMDMLKEKDRHENRTERASRNERHNEVMVRQSRIKYILGG